VDVSDPGWQGILDLRNLGLLDDYALARAISLAGYAGQCLEKVTKARLSPVADHKRDLDTGIVFQRRFPLQIHGPISKGPLHQAPAESWKDFGNMQVRRPLPVASRPNSGAAYRERLVPVSKENPPRMLPGAPDWPH